VLPAAEAKVGAVVANVAGEEVAAVIVRFVPVGSSVAEYPVPAVLRSAAICWSVEGVVMAALLPVPPLPVPKTPADTVYVSFAEGACKAQLAGLPVPAVAVRSPEVVKVSADSN